MVLILPLIAEHLLGDALLSVMIHFRIDAQGYG